MFIEEREIPQPALSNTYPYQVPREYGSAGFHVNLLNCRQQAMGFDFLPWLWIGYAGFFACQGALQSARRFGQHLHGEVDIRNSNQSAETINEFAPKELPFRVYCGFV
jgi:hypothetical protein